MTGSKPQLYNGIALLVTFFSCRLVWGTWQSAVVYADMWRGLRGPPSPATLAAAFADPATSADPHANPMAFARDAAAVPLWLTALYLASNVVLNALNWFWFVKMVAAVRKRFEPPKQAKKEAVEGEKVSASAVDGTAAAAAVKRRARAPSIEDVVPDSDELREGTIQ